MSEVQQKIVYCCIPHDNKPEGKFCSKSEYEKQVKSGKFVWTDSYHRNANIGDIYCFVRNESKKGPGFVKVHLVEGIIEGEFWADNYDEEARLLKLSPMLYDMPHSDWLKLKGCARVSRAYFCKVGTKLELLNEIRKNISPFNQNKKEKSNRKTSKTSKVTEESYEPYVEPETTPSDKKKKPTSRPTTPEKELKQKVGKGKGKEIKKPVLQDVGNIDLENMELEDEL